MVLPVKRLGAGKTRLRGALPAVSHERLALALALDTVAAALDCPEVAVARVVTDDPLVAQASARLGADVVPDLPDAGLNAALLYGLGRQPAGIGVPPGGRAAAPAAALTADLPALRAAELAAALRAAQAANQLAFVPDAAGTGTTLLAAPAGVAMCPRFGPGSAAAHTAGGALALAGEWPSLRRDVDTAADLAAAVRLGVGRHTRALVAGYGARMQGTVATYDPESRSGTVLLDDGTQVEFGSAAFDAGGLRLLRFGQRLQLEQDATGAVTRVTLPTLP